MKQTTKRLFATGAALAAFGGGGFVGGHFEGKSQGETTCGETLSTKDIGYVALNDADRVEFGKHIDDPAFYESKYPDLTKALGGTTTTHIIDVGMYHSDDKQVNRDRVAAAYPLGDVLHRLAPHIQELKFNYDLSGEPNTATTITVTAIGCQNPA